jgi:hypothetical protein
LVLALIPYGKLCTLEKMFDVLSLLHLDLMVLVLFLGDRFPDLRSAQLLENLVEFPGCQVALEDPFLFPAGIGAQFGGFASCVGVFFSNRMRDGSQRLVLSLSSVPPNSTVAPQPIG